MARASVAAHSRRDRSVNTGDKAACFARSVATSTGEPYHAVISQYKRLMFDGPLAQLQFAHMDDPVHRVIPVGVAGTQPPSVNPLSAYPHWLDSDYLTLVGLQNPEAHATIARSVNRTLKLQAIIGRRFVLSDPQAVDCPPLFELFGLE